MAEEKKEKGITLKRLKEDAELRKDLGLNLAAVQMMEFNARRYAKTDADANSFVIGFLSSNPEIKGRLEKMPPEKGLPLENSLYMNNIDAQKYKKLTVKNILDAAGASYSGVDEKLMSPEEKLLSLYKRNPNRLLNRVEQDPDFGKIGREHVPDVINGILAQMESHKRKPTAMQSVLGTLFAPRSLERMENGQPSSVKDLALDIAENLAMAAPMGIATGAAAKRIDRISKLPGVLKSMFKGGSNVGLNAAVPVTTELADNFAYDVTDNPYRSTFNPYDAGMHTVTNIMTPFKAMRLWNRTKNMIGAKAAADAVDEAVQSSAAKKVLKDMAESYIMNKAGQDRQATGYMGMLGQFIPPSVNLPGIVSDAAEEIRYDDIGLAREAQMADALDRDDLDAADRYWLSNLIGLNDQVKKKYNVEDRAVMGREPIEWIQELGPFGNWWATRGSQLFTEPRLWDEVLKAALDDDKKK